MTEEIEPCGSGGSSGSAHIVMEKQNGQQNGGYDNDNGAPPPYAAVVAETNVDSGNALPPPVHPPAYTNRWYAVDRDMLVCKMAYFFDQMKEASIWPFLIVFHVESGLTTLQAGTINGLRFIGCLLGGPFWGWLADEKRMHRPLIIIITLMAILLQCSQPFTTEHLGREDLNCCPQRTNLSVEEREHKQATDKSYFPGQNVMFGVLLAISVCACFFDGVTLSFVDAGVQRKIRTINRPIDFGRTRMFGSIGYAVGSALSSTAIMYFFHVELSCYAGAFVLYAVAGFCLIACFNALYRGSNATTETSSATTQSTASDEKVNKIILDTLKNPHILFFLGTTLFNGMMRALVFMFTYLYLKELKAEQIVLGTSQVVGQISSIIFYFLAEWIIKKCGGTMQTMTLSCFCWVIRLLCLAFMKSYYVIYAINCLNGVTASLFVAASIIHVRKTCPPQAFAAMYGIRNSLFNGGGYILAGVVGGEMYEMFGPHKLFLGTCLICAAWVTMMVLYLIKFRNLNNQNNVAIEMVQVNQEQQKDEVKT